MELISKESATEVIRHKYLAIFPYLNERSRRIWAANEANAYGRGGNSIVHKATGMDYKTIKKGQEELKQSPAQRADINRIRKKGGGRKKEIEKDTTLQKNLESLIEPFTRGDASSPLLWTCKSTRNLAKELNKAHHHVSHALVRRLLIHMGYSLQANRKTHEGSSHPDRNRQFHYINQKARLFQKQNQPVISVDTKKKENIGNFKNSGRDYHRKGQAPEVNVYDFIDKDKGKVAPYGVYDLSKNTGWVSVGVSSDTAQFAVNSIRGWWNEMGKEAYPETKKLLITADCGGSNGYRNRLWKVELQKFANETGLFIHVSHFPPGTSKWNKIEHRMFSFISRNWRGRPLIDRATVVQLIANTKTSKGLKIRARLDENVYEKGIKVSDEEFQKVNLRKYKFHGEWNYSIAPSN